MSDQSASNEASNAPAGAAPASAEPSQSPTEALPKGGCAGAHAAWVQGGQRGQFVMRAMPVPEIVPPPPVAATPSPPSGELYGICNKREIRDRMGKSFPLMRRWTDGKLRPWDVFIARFGKEYHAYVNECPHQHVRLDWEKNNFFEPNYLKLLMCGKHGSQFDPETGVCISGPCKGAQLEKIVCFVDDEDDVVLAGINIDLEAEIGPAAGDPSVDEVLENNGFKLQSTKREFL
ncbi:Rieske (2Fe-2S) protein [Methylocapsa aurea]|uniref:Rieske (2Fe-2S) protein n=1 Tax=Methylocapsa aurea TaxID=663610 RepID=UPI000690C2BC|nr:Rieske (2Fe-2S) protein [Methylocapsa aurea]